MLDEEEKRPVDEIYTSQLITELDDAKKESRLSEDVRKYNKMKNHFSKSTADESEIGVRDLECLLYKDQGAVVKKPGEHNNRSSSVIGSIGF